MVIVVAGVAGAGKTTVGRALAARLGWTFADADDYHTAANKERLARGEALTDEDRAPWLGALNEAIREWVAAGRDAVLACSALKARYRTALRAGAESDVRFVFLDDKPARIAERLRSRRGHFAGVSLLASQLAALERPRPGEALTVTVDRGPDELARVIADALALRAR